MSLFLRALAAFIALPGMIGFVIPWLMRPKHGEPHFHGVALMAAGIFLLLWCVRDFYVTGLGTLAPWSPPKRLVRVGLYRFSRNPMYIGVITLLAGWALAYQSRTLVYYAIGVAIAFHFRVVLFEEPWLARTHGAEFEEYRARVSRWLGWQRGA